MIGKTITGKVYNPETLEISSRNISARVIEKSVASIKLWPNGSQTPFAFSVDVLLCAPFDGVSFNSSDCVIIPGFLLESIESTQGNIDYNPANFIEGKETIFDVSSLNAFIEGETKRGIPIETIKCPVIFWESQSSPRIPCESDFFVCYPIENEEINYDKLIFIKSSSAKFQNPNFIDFENFVKYYYQNYPPEFAKEGDIWFHSDTGVFYFYVLTGDSLVWVQSQ